MGVASVCGNHIAQGHTLASVTRPGNSPLMKLPKRPAARPVGTNGAIYTSADGLTWQSQVSGTTNELTAITRTATGYIAVGAAGTYLTSQ